MIRRTLFFIWMFWGLWLSASHAGGIRSHVTIMEGLTRKRVTIPAYQLRGARTTTAQQTSHSVDELSRVAVYLEGAGLDPGKPLKLEMRQEGRQFEPDILIVPTGSTVSF